MRDAVPAHAALSTIVFGGPDPLRRLPASAIVCAVLIHVFAVAIAWWSPKVLRLQPLAAVHPVMQLDRTVEVELKKPEPRPMAEPPPQPVSKPVQKQKPQPAPRLPLKTTVARTKPQKAPPQPAEAAQVITRDSEPAAAADPSSFDIVTGGAAQYPGGVTASSGKSKVAAPEVRASYQDALLAWMERHKRYPRNALRRRIEGRPILEIRIDRGGRLLAYELTKSSNNTELDEAALAMVRRAEPFPPIPNDHGESMFVFRFGVDFSINGR